jgi:hypothetical protein
MENIMKKVALITLISVVAGCAAFDRTDTTAQPTATGDKPVTASPTPQRGQPSGSSAGNDTAGAFWTEHSRGGYMTKEQAMGYKDPTNKPMDWARLDSDRDSRVSQQEWNVYHIIILEPAGPAGRTGQ